MDLAKPRTLKALEAMIGLDSFTQYALWKKAGTSFETVHNLVHFLQEKNVVAKTNKEYRVTTWPGLLGLFAAYRTFPKPFETLQLAVSRKDAEDYFSSKKFILCLTSAWKYYDDYLRDPQLHYYLPNQNLPEVTMNELSQFAKGTTTLNIYRQDLPVTPVKHGSSLTTSLPRTLLDLYSSHYAYATDNWIKKKALKWQQE